MPFHVSSDQKRFSSYKRELVGLTGESRDVIEVGAEGETPVATVTPKPAPVEQMNEFLNIKWISLEKIRGQACVFLEFTDGSVSLLIRENADDEFNHSAGPGAVAHAPRWGSKRQAIDELFKRR